MARQSPPPLDASSDLCPVLVSNLSNVSNSGVGGCACVREREGVRARVCVYDDGFTRSLKFATFGKIEGLCKDFFFFFFLT